jgi:phage terminase large subunit
VREIKGLEGIDIAWVEEAQIVSDNSWELLIPSIRKEGSEIWMSFNPKNPTDPTWQRFVVNADDNTLVQKVSWRDNPFFPSVLDIERKKLLKDDPEAYAHIWEGEFDTRYSGAVYAKWVKQENVRDGIVSNVSVHTAWDLGYDDATAIWFWQVVGKEVRWIDYYESSGQDIEHYVNVIKSKMYTYGDHYVPHDAANKLLAAGGRSIVQQAFGMGVKMRVVAATSQQNQIEALRLVLQNSYFEKDKTKDGVNALMQYHFEYDERKGMFKSHPRHDWSSHGADAAEIVGQVMRERVESKPKPAPKFFEQATANDVFWGDLSSKPQPRGRI